MILTPGTLSDHDPPPDAPRVCPQCHTADAAVVIVIADYRPAQTVCVCLACSYTVLDGAGADGGGMLNVLRVRMADGWWAVLLALPIVLATAVGTSAVGAFCCWSAVAHGPTHGRNVSRPAGSSWPGPPPCGLPLASRALSGTGLGQRIVSVERNSDAARISHHLSRCDYRSNSSEACRPAVALGIDARTRTRRAAFPLAAL